MSEFLFIRHGQSEGNAHHIVAGPESPLTQLGADQAKQAAIALQTMSITKIISSPLLRAQQTAKIIAVELGIDPTDILTLDSLRERRYGSLQDKPKSHPTEWYYTGNEQDAETTTELFARMSLCLEELKELSKHDRPLVVGHAVSGFYLIQIAHSKTSIDLFDPSLQMGNAEVIKVSF